MSRHQIDLTIKQITQVEHQGHPLPQKVIAGRQVNQNVNVAVERCLTAGDRAKYPQVARPVLGRQSPDSPGVLLQLFEIHAVAYVLMSLNSHHSTR